MTPGNVFEKAARLVTAAAVCTLLSGCFHSHHGSHAGGHSSEVHAEHEHGGPPPWAPAHGHRRKHEAHPEYHAHGGDSGGVKVVFDSERGVHVVIGFPHHYYDTGHYYRVEGGRWEVSAVFEGPWLEIQTTKVPASLRHARKKAKKSKKHGKPARWGD